MTEKIWDVSSLNLNACCLSDIIIKKKKTLASGELLHYEILAIMVPQDELCGCGSTNGCGDLEGKYCPQKHIIKKINKQINKVHRLFVRSYTKFLKCHSVYRST